MKTLVVIDTALNAYQRLLPDSPEDCEVFLIDSSQDGFKQLAGYLDGKNGYGAIHVYSHGSSGRLSLGSASMASSEDPRFIMSALLLRLLRTCYP